MQAPAPPQPNDCGMATEALVTHVLLWSENSPTTPRF
jgi:hypothetical protein